MHTQYRAETILYTTGRNHVHNVCGWRCGAIHKHYGHGFAIHGFGISSTAMSAMTTSVLKYLEHRNVCVSLAGNNLELPGNGEPELQATAIRSRFGG